MFDNFIDWGMLATYGTLSTLTFTVVEFTKEIPIINKIKTKYYSAIIAFTLILLTQLHATTFNYWDIVLYILSAIVISLGANGLSNFNKDKKISIK